MTCFLQDTRLRTGNVYAFSTVYRVTAAVLFPRSTGTKRKENTKHDFFGIVSEASRE